MNPTGTDLGTALRTEEPDAEPATPEQRIGTLRARIAYHRSPLGHDIGLLFG